jgi:hypothetical protein
MDKLKRLMSLCKCGVFVEVNHHRNYYETAEQYLSNYEERDEEPCAEPEIREKMIKDDTVIEIQFYDRTPVSFYKVYHYDLDMALDEALECLEKSTQQ